MAGSWRGKKPIQRNAIIILARYKDKTAVPDLIDCLQNDQDQSSEELPAGRYEKLVEEMPKKLSSEHFKPNKMYKYYKN